MLIAENAQKLLPQYTGGMWLDTGVEAWWVDEHPELGGEIIMYRRRLVLGPTISVREWAK